jgi:abortive infection bacteriophage resistance protein
MSKQALTIADQIDLLAARGLRLAPGEKDSLSRFLLNANYFRASGYWRLFQNDPLSPQSGFRSGISFSDIQAIYDWDNELRHQLLRGLADYEVVFRARFAYYFSLQFEPESFATPDVHREIFRDTKRGLLNLRSELLNSLRRDLKRASEPTVLNALNAGKSPPIWTAIESLSMGTVSKMYEVANNDIRHELSRSLGLPNPDFAESLFRSLTIFRNHLAHHGRVWHHTPDFPPPVLRKLKTSSDVSIYERTPWAVIIGLSHQINAISKSETWSATILKHIDSNPKYLTGLTHPLKKGNGYPGLGETVAHHGD